MKLKQLELDLRDKNLEQCVWKVSYNRSLKGDGTTFAEYIKNDKYCKCKSCDGYDSRKHCYIIFDFDETENHNPIDYTI